jgi:hypothetical protein
VASVFADCGDVEARRRDLGRCWGSTVIRWPCGCGAASGRLDRDTFGRRWELVEGVVKRQPALGAAERAKQSDVSRVDDEEFNRLDSVLLTQPSIGDEKVAHDLLRRQLVAGEAACNAWNASMPSIAS